MGSRLRDGVLTKMIALSHEKVDGSLLAMHEIIVCESSLYSGTRDTRLCTTMYESANIIDRLFKNIIALVTNHGTFDDGSGGPRVSNLFSRDISSTHELVALQN